MKKINLIGLLVCLLLILSLILVSSNPFRKSSAPYDRSMTKAICNEKNYCEDYEIFCKNEQVIRFVSTGASIQLSENWEDPRAPEKRNLSCK